MITLSALVLHFFSLCYTNCAALSQSGRETFFMYIISNVNQEPWHLWKHNKTFNTNSNIWVVCEKLDSKSRDSIAPY